MLLEGIRVAAGGMGRLAPEHGPGPHRLPQEIPLGARPVVAFGEDDTPGGADLVDELDEVIF